MGRAGRCLAGAAACHAAVGGPALLRTQRRRLAGGQCSSLGQPLEPPHARGVDHHDAARRAARRGLASRGWRPVGCPKAGADGGGAGAGPALAQGPDSGGLFEPGAVQGRTGRHRRTVPQPVRQGAPRTGCAGSRGGGSAGPRAQRPARRTDRAGLWRCQAVAHPRHRPGAGLRRARPVCGGFARAPFVCRERGHCTPPGAQTACRSDSGPCLTRIARITRALRID